MRPELVGLGRLVGLAPKRMLEIGRALGVANGRRVPRRGARGRLPEVPGIGPHTERSCSSAWAGARAHAPAGPHAQPGARAVTEEVRGGARRRGRRRPAPLGRRAVRPRGRRRGGRARARSSTAFEALPAIVAVVERSERRALGVTVEGVPVELVVAEPARFGTELLRATGSAAYVEALGPLPDAPDEAAVYAALGVPWCPPELREAPFRGEPPRLVELDDIRGDLHCHTTWSDGKASVLEMAPRRATSATSTSRSATTRRTCASSRASTPTRCAARREEIAAANEQLAPFRILRGAEVDIRSDGSLDLPDDVLAELDWVQLSLHAGQREERRAADAEGHRGDAPSGGALPQPPDTAG